METTQRLGVPGEWQDAPELVRLRAEADEALREYDSAGAFASDEQLERRITTEQASLRHFHRLRTEAWRASAS